MDLQEALFDPWFSFEEWAVLVGGLSGQSRLANTKRKLSGVAGERAVESFLM